MSSPKNLKKLTMLRDIVVATLDNWISVENLIAESDVSDRSTLADLAESAFNAFSKATTAISDYSAASAPPTSAPPTSAPAVEVTVITEPTKGTATVPAIPVKSGENYLYTWHNLPQWFKLRVAAHNHACDGGRDAQRSHELWNGGWVTLPNKKRVMVYRNHAYEQPADRSYSEPGPLKHLGVYSRATRSLEPAKEPVPEILQTLEGYPWISAYEVHNANKKALGAA